MKKIAILGSAGMLGHMVYTYLNSLSRYDIVDASYPFKLHPKSRLLDVTDKNALETFIKTEQPDVLVNCIGALIKGSKNNPANAIFLNSYLPHFLVSILRKNKGRLIHISTDCVFSGKKGRYVETDFRDADDVYGRSKALGEIINDIDVTLRTSIIGPELKQEGEGLFHWFMQQSGTVKGFTQALWSGVTTLELAKVVGKVIEQNTTGLIHITNGRPIAKFNLLQEIQTVFNRSDIIIEKDAGVVTDKSLVSVRNDLKYNVASYTTMIEEMKSFMAENKFLYQSLYKL